jgi:hypothetical protein
MSEATERPAADADAWATACAEDLAAEKARHRASSGQPAASASEELRKLVDAVADRVSSLQNPLFGMAAQGAVQQLINQARTAVEPVLERNPGVFDHLAAAGNEILAAYRSAVENQESRWTKDSAGRPSGTMGGGRSADDTRTSDDPTDPRDEGAGPGGRIDLD